MKLKSLFTLFLILSTGFAWAASFTVVDVTGEPQFRAKGSLKKVTIQKTDKLDEGGRIKMKDGEFLVMTTPMGDEIKLVGKTYMKLNELSGDNTKSTLKVELFQGIATNKVHKLSQSSVFELTTPSAVAGVRGTEFMAEVAPTGDTEIAVLEGEVGVTDVEGSSDPVPVTAGKSAKVKRGGGISVKAVANIRKRANAKAAKAAKISVKKAAASAGAAPGASGPAASEAEGEAPAESSEPESTEETSVEEAAVEDEIVVEEDFAEAAAEAASEAIEEAVEAAVEEAQEAINDQLDGDVQEAKEETSNVSVEVDVESINR